MVLGDARIARATAVTAPSKVASTLAVAGTPATPRIRFLSRADSFWCTSRWASASTYAPAVVGGLATNFSGLVYVNWVRLPAIRSAASFHPLTIVPADVQAT